MNQADVYIFSLINAIKQTGFPGKCDFVINRYW